MRLAAQIGIPISEFWEMTFSELNIYIEVYREKSANESADKYNLAIMQAYLTSRWVGAKKVDINKYLNKGEQKPMTDDDMLEKIKSMNSLLGGNISYVRG